MRLFIAMLFDAHTQNVFSEMQEKLTGTGRRVLKDNLHLTLRFLGEGDAQDVERVCDAMQKACDVRPFSLRCKGINCFKPSKKGRLIYAQIGGDATLYVLQAQLEQKLREKGFAKAEERFIPHVTLCREYQGELAKHIEEFPFVAERVALMESRQDQGVLRYHPIFVKQLTGGDE
ncbi:MAG: RNA 2',3'-cyclic phosphodiesterase [Christensenellales bacterium]|jgi:2'-5' RNA ligase